MIRQNIIKIICAALIPILLLSIKAQAQIVINRVDGDLAKTLENLVDHHSKKLMAPFLNADLEWAYNNFPISEFIKHQQLFKQAVELMIQSQRFDARELVYLSGMSLTKDEQVKYLSLIPPEGEFWYPDIVPAPNSFAIEIFKLNQGLNSKDKISELITQGDSKMLIFVLTLPELINDPAMLKRLLQEFHNQQDAYVVSVDCTNNDATIMVQFCDLTFNFFVKKFPSNYKLLFIKHTPHQLGQTNIVHKIDHMDRSPEKVKEYYDFFLAKIEEHYPEKKSPIRRKRR